VFQLADNIGIFEHAADQHFSWLATNAKISPITHGTVLGEVACYQITLDIGIIVIIMIYLYTYVQKFIWHQNRETNLRHWHRVTSRWQKQNVRENRLTIHTANQCTKFEGFSFSHSTYSLGRQSSCPFQGQFVIRSLGLAVINLSIKFEVSKLTHYEDMKRNAKC